MVGESLSKVGGSKGVNGKKGDALSTFKGDACGTEGFWVEHGLGQWQGTWPVQAHPHYSGHTGQYRRGGSCHQLTDHMFAQIIATASPGWEMGTHTLTVGDI